jgi:hypothetical protein
VRNQSMHGRRKPPFYTFTCTHTHTHIHTHQSSAALPLPHTHTHTHTFHHGGELRGEGWEEGGEDAEVVQGEATDLLDDGRIEEVWDGAGGICRYIYTCVCVRE